MTLVDEIDNCAFTPAHHDGAFQSDPMQCRPTLGPLGNLAVACVRFLLRIFYLGDQFRGSRYVLFNADYVQRRAESVCQTRREPRSLLVSRTGFRPPSEDFRSS